ncbi:hypothetical protein [Photobacterium lutimaris]|uniref:hypothetical protein n=1 Tax=Photobacterium lutimaris TaxID=388278 RepID=UPI0014152955|nr:hypothetical protein [Photobacterium lutimaris]
MSMAEAVFTPLFSKRMVLFAPQVSWLDNDHDEGGVLDFLGFNDEGIVVSRNETP